MSESRHVARRLLGVAATVAVATGLVVADLSAPEPPVSFAADVATTECRSFPIASSGPVPQLSSFAGQTPERIIDTRDGTGGVGEPVDDGCVLRIDLDAAGIPANAGALALSVTALGQRAGFQQVFPCDDGRPETSNVNNRPGAFPTPGLVLGLPDANREICVFTLFEADLIVDVSGWWTEEGPTRFRAVDPVRVDDSRESPGFAPGGDTPRPIDLSGFVPAGTTSIVANLTVTEPTAPGFLVIFPCGTPAPTASNLNFLPGESRAVSVVVGLDADRRVCTSSNTEHHVILDLAGYYGPAPQFGPAGELRPEAGNRLADSRDGTGGWSTPIGRGQTRSLDIASRLPDGSQVTGVIVNVTVTDHQAPGFVTVTRCGAGEPETSSVNYLPGGVASNLVVVDLGTSSSLCVFSLEEANVIIDLYGVLRAETDEMLAERIGIGGHTWPPYRPEAPNYVTECVDPLPVDLDLLAGTRARINGVSVQSGTTDVDLRTLDDLVRLELRRNGTVQRYDFQCVPDDFRRADVFVAPNPEPGWYLTVLPALGTAPVRVAILDEFGAPVWYQDAPEPIAVFDRANDGNLIAVPIRGSRFSVDPDRGNVKVRLDGGLLAEYVSVDETSPPPGAAAENPTDHHDHVELPGGGAALISYPLYENVDLSALGAGFSTSDVITDNLIQEIDADGDLVWQWRMSDHFAFTPGSGATKLTLAPGNDEISYPQRWDVPGGYETSPQDVDVFHINSLDRIADGSGDYVVSARHNDAVFRVDRTTGDVDWILRSVEVTSPNASGAPVLTIIGDPRGGPRRPHDALLVGDLLTVFDNRTDTGQPARAVTYRIDDVANTATFVSAIEHPGGETSAGLGSFRPQPNGNSLVSWGAPIQPMVQEFASNGSLRFSFALLGGGNTYRAIRYPKNAFNELELQLTSGSTMQLPS